MKKVLYGEDYDLPRIAGIMHEMFVKHYGRQQRNNEIATYLTGYIATREIEIDEETVTQIGYIIDTDSEYFDYLPQVHQSRLIEIVEGDGWINNSDEV
jgi:hypothetical protein